MSESKWDDESKHAPEEKHDDESKMRDGQDDRDEDDDDFTVTIRLMIQPDNFPHEIDVPLSGLVADLKREAGHDLRLQVNLLTLQHPGSGEVIKEAVGGRPVTMQDLGFQRNETVELDLLVDVENAVEEHVLPACIDVVVWDTPEDGSDPVRRVISVSILRDESHKPFLGGFRDKRNGIEYHHAKTQCSLMDVNAKKRERATPKVVVEKFHRDTQTYVAVTRSLQTTRENGTQMIRPDLYIDNSSDVELQPGSYFDSEQDHQLKLAKTITLQRHWRGFKARERAEHIREALKDRQRAMEEVEEKQREEARKRQEQEVARRINPKSFADFEILYNELENWRHHETLRIKHASDLQPHEKQAALQELLEKETKLLQTIDRLKITANEENKVKRIEKMLSLMASPKKWEASDGQCTIVHTPFTNRAAELLELYHGLQNKACKTEERLDLLLHVKWTVKEFDCNLTREVVELIDREADLLNRGRSSKSMVGLRKRIENLFLQFIETPEFNPEAARFQKVPREMMSRPNVRPIR